MLEKDEMIALELAKAIIQAKPEILGMDEIDRSVLQNYAMNAHATYRAAVDVVSYEGGQIKG